MKLLDFMASPEGQMMDRMGFEGEEYTKDGDTITVTDKIAHLVRPLLRRRQLDAAGRVEVAGGAGSR